MLLAAATATGVLAGAGPGETAHRTAGRPAVAAPLPRSVGRLLGQRIMVGFSGTSPSPALLGAVRRGEVGAVILYAANLARRGQSLAMTAALQRAARAGGNPELLVAVDQEGGEVKRIAGPPALSPPQIAATHSLAVAQGQGRATAGLLRAWGINMDLAPVADVPTFRGAFIWLEGRAFSFVAGRVAAYASAFARGLQAGGVAATAKDFPGVGSAASDTDIAHAELRPSAAQRADALVPFRRMIAQGLDAVMVSVAGFPAYDGSGVPAAISRPIVSGLLRRRLRFEGVAITDALRTISGPSEVKAGVLAARAGADILLFNDSAPGELAALRRAYQRHQITAAAAAASYRRIIALKRGLGLA